jgi:hypothetical protein
LKVLRLWELLPILLDYLYWLQFFFRSAFFLERLAHLTEQYIYIIHIYISSCYSSLLVIPSNAWPSRTSQNAGWIGIQVTRGHQGSMKIWVAGCLPKSHENWGKHVRKWGKSKARHQDCGRGAGRWTGRWNRPVPWCRVVPFWRVLRSRELGERESSTVFCWHRSPFSIFFSLDSLVDCPRSSRSQPFLGGDDKYDKCMAYQTSLTSVAFFAKDIVVTPSAIPIGTLVTSHYIASSPNQSQGGPSEFLVFSLIYTETDPPTL